MKLTFLGHTSFRIDGKDNLTIYIDPSDEDEEGYEQKADIILVSHEEYGHLDYDLIRKISVDETIIISTPQVDAEIDCEVLAPGEETTIKGVKIKAVHAYSTDEEVGRKKGEALGFIITIEGRIIYFAGTTHLIEEMNDIVCDIALLPVSGTKTMRPQDAVEAIKIIKPKIAIPMHYGYSHGTIDDAELFADLTRQKTNTHTIILKEDESFEF